MTSPFPPPPPSQWGPDGTGEPSDMDDPPAKGPTSYELYPAEGGGWPDQPVTSVPSPQQPPPGYPPQGYPPPQGYAPQPPPPPVYAPAPYAPPQYMPGPPVKSGGNKGWIIGGIVAGALVIVCVVGIIVIGALVKADEEEPLAYTPTVAAAPAGGSYSNPSDLCDVIDIDRYATAFAMEQDGTPSNTSSDSSTGAGYGWSSCYISLDREEPTFDYASLSVDLTIDSADYLETSYDSAVSAMSGTSYSGPSIGEESDWSAGDSTYGESLSVVIRNGNAVLRVSLSDSADAATREGLANLIVDTANEVFNAI
ncbi:hypothetical protein [Phytomonospora endophytica]|uniref:Uncharacterized protein n=1 Tax=Phytomonospora endophytica TaxID=714109 RepID=A0A841G5I6_9ACTN|nr:hypothetical protein [Phytomonospora endophytica]MBB6040029.1 hypothetical protein [Phytomonospora endophytica]